VELATAVQFNLAEVVVIEVTFNPVGAVAHIVVPGGTHPKEFSRLDL
jgi:hypothetical protein